MAAPKQTDPQFKLRLTPEIKEIIEKSASQNNRSMNAEILARLEDSGSIEGYQELAELFLETMKENAARSKREVEEYRQMVTTIRLMRHTIERLRQHLGDDIPDDIQTLLGFLTPNSNALDTDYRSLMMELYESMDRHEKMLEEDDNLEGEGSTVRRDKIKRLMENLNRRLAE